ncbi:hypothetical protein [Lysobacter soli]|uniref:hypothetical protein n=1 Tax=Lysobacter soli TaxID=453783 RepID=UPI00240EBC83|nr:hypothetical protein [Lysobacter soli]MDG2516393.1 hypothetical protein [Lysobacter soli]
MPTHPHRSQAANSVAGALSLARDARKEPPLPANAGLDEPEVAAHYRALWAARAPSDWKEAELTLIARVARLEFDLRNEESRLAEEGCVVAGKLNPRVRAVETLSRRHIAYLNALRLSPTPTENRAIANRAKELQHMRPAPEAMRDERWQLLAGPMPP